MKNKCLLVLTLLIVYATAIQADTLSLNNGDQLTGKLLGFSSEVLEFKTEYAGTLRINQKHVASIETENEFLVENQDGERQHIQFFENTDLSKLVLARQDQGVLGIANSINNRLSASLSYSHGNSTTQLYVVTSETEMKRDKSEHILKSLLNYDVAEGNLLKNQSNLNYKGRRLLGKKNFITFVSDVYRDRLKGTDLRFSPVVGFGRNLWDHTYGRLTIESGLAAIYEWQEDTQLKDPALSWELTYSKRFLGGKFEVFHSNKALKTIDSGALFESSNELRYALFDNLDLNFLAQFKHDTEVPIDVEKSDFTYVAGLGLSF